MAHPQGCGRLMGLSRILIHLPVNILALVLAAAGQHIGHPLHLSAVVFEETADHAAAPSGPHRGTDDDKPVIFQLSFRFKSRSTGKQSTKKPKGVKVPPEDEPFDVEAYAFDYGDDDENCLRV